MYKSYKMGYIYMLENKINGKIYIGQTIRPIHTRLEEHKKKTSGCVAIYNAIQKYGWDNFEKDWYECPDEDLNFDEDFLVREMGTLSPDGYNLVEGGGNRGKRSDETKRKMRESQLGKTLSVETKRKIGKARLGHTVSEETRQKIGKAHIGKTINDEVKQKMRESSSGDKHHSSKRVYQYDIDGNFINSFASSGEAGRHLKKNDGLTIRNCANGKYKTAYNFKWSYVKQINLIDHH